ncbi:MAG: tetratricopeptide repeat protein [Rhodocyclales bacterium]|nr:tetratricopeptide repeat protein [Rhodocyclales bacterium]
MKLNGATLVVLAALLLVAGCAAQRTFQQGTELIEAGDFEAGLAKVDEAMKLDPGKHEYRGYYYRQREIALQRLLAQGEAARQQGQWEAAETAYRKAAELDPKDSRPKAALDGLAVEQRHQALLREAEAALKEGKLEQANGKARAVLAENPQHRAALGLLRKIEEKTRSATREPQLDAALRRPITLEFRDTDLRSVFELISRNTGINFFFDKDVRPDHRTTVLVRNTSIDDVIRFILVTNQLERKVLGHNTILIYPNNPAKVKEYQDLVTKSFYLAHADVKQTASMVKTLVKTKDVFFDEKLKLLVMRDTPDAIRMAEKLIAAQDLAQSEVMLEVEVMEVASSLLTDLGIRYPSQVSYAVVGSGGTPGTVTLPEWLNRSAGLYRISFSNPLLVLNFKDQLTKSNLLANPRIRVMDGQKARVHIGDRVPVITSNITATSLVSESVSYLDVGLKLEVEPGISLDNEVVIKVGLEVSNIVREIRSTGGTLTYQLGTRNANTMLHLKDGETQILAGLINDEDRKTADRVPGLGGLPVVGRLFSSHNDTATKTEIVLLITPRILRTVARPDAQTTEFMSGTENAIGAPPLVLRPMEAQPATTGKAAAADSPKPAAAASPALPAAGRLILRAPAQIKTAETFTVTVDLAAETALRAGTFELAFDQARLAVEKVEEGELLKKTGKDPSFRYNLQQDAGRLSVSYAVSEDLKGEGNLVKISFQATGPHPGTTIVRMEAQSALDAAGKPLGIAPPVPLTLSLARP